MRAPILHEKTSPPAAIQPLLKEADEGLGLRQG